MKKENNALAIAAEQLGPADEPTGEIDLLGLGKWIGRAQAAQVYRAISDVAIARAIKHIKESGVYKQTGMDWEAFCQTNFGFSYVTANQAIATLDRFGEHYFTLASLVKISPDSYALISGDIDEYGLDLDGEKVPITKANAPRLQKAINDTRRAAAIAKREAEEAKTKAELAMADRDAHKKAADLAHQKLRALLNPRHFEGADDDYKTMLGVQAGIDTALARLNGLRGHELSEDNQRHYVCLCDYLHTAFLRAVDDAKVTFDSYLDPADPGISLHLNDPGTEHGKNILAEFAKTTRKDSSK